MRVLAVDGGQSGIRVGHSTTGRVIEVPGVSRVEGDTIAAVADAVTHGWLEGGFGATDRVVMGLSTAPTDEASQARLCNKVNRVIDAQEVWLADDSVTCHAGALSLGWGVSITAGTGVACMVLPEVGEPSVVGGHGYLLGDEGGAFWVGREGLRGALRAVDGRGPGTGLVEAATTRFGDVGTLGARLHDVPRPVNEIAQFAPVVLAMADAGDEVATRAADEAVTELVILARAAVAAARQGSPWHQARVPVALGGRLLLEGEPLRRRLDARLATEGLGADVRSADGPPLDGALALGALPDPGRYGSMVHVWRDHAVVPPVRARA